MTPLEIIRQAQADTLVDEDGQAVTLELLPGLSQRELRDFARQVPCRVPREIAELLGACRGFYGTVEQVDFTGRDLMFEFEAVFPFGLPIAADGYGNFWVVDLGVLSAFARELDDSYGIIDLRRAKPGDGFSWGRYGPNTLVKRFGVHAVFAYQKPRSLVSRLFGRAG